MQHSRSIAAKKRLEHDESNKLRDVGGVSSLISDQQVVQLLSAAVSTLLKGLAAGTADSYFPENQMKAFQQLGSGLSFCMSACREIWPEGRSSSSDKR